ncbi:hypothetical protein AMATHDRAFT_66112 [Amanita thiersii Skay4041]|uniref:FAS1 domain-containing protein n=1 Tax=Amanita thiersii Skay4041 TaxID=703135 RepID=A0A2A9NAV7_9AGAR|nr:hypothetical protein AMATHDRAFT_66112 [Amanita thiersii Skay4041]
MFRAVLFAYLCLFFSVFTASLADGRRWNAAFLGALVNDLQNEGYTEFGNTILRINQTLEGQRILPQLVNGNFTIFVPTDQALANFNQSNNTAVNDTESLANIIAYHILPGNYTLPTPGTNGTLISAVFPNTTVGRTLLDNSTVVQLEGGRSQVLAWSTFPGAQTPTILNQVSQGQSVSVVNVTTFNNLLLVGVDAVLIPPGNLTTTLEANDLGVLEGLLSLSFLPEPAFRRVTGVNCTTSLLNTLEEQQGYTLFAPNNNAFFQSSQEVVFIVGNRIILANIVRNHVINGTTVYSPELFNTSASYTSAAGEPFTFFSNSSGNFVTVDSNSQQGGAGSTARIIQPDVLVSNGVLHVIDRVLLDAAANEQAASSAVSSASSAATVSVSPTGPIGGVPFPASPSVTTTATSPSATIVTATSTMVVGGGPTMVTATSTTVVPQRKRHL